MSFRTLRNLPTLARSFSSTPLARATPPARPFVRRTAVPIRAASASSPASASTPAPAAAEYPEDPSVPAPPASFDYDDFPSPSPSSAPSQPTEGSTFPNDAYKSLPGAPQGIPGEAAVTDWTTSFAGLSERPFPKEAAEALMAPLNQLDIEIKPGELTLHSFICFRSEKSGLTSGMGRWDAVLPGDQVPSSTEPCVRARRMGTCPARRDERGQQDSQPRVGIGVSRQVSHLSSLSSGLTGVKASGGRPR